MGPRHGRLSRSFAGSDRTFVNNESSSCSGQKLNLKVALLAFAPAGAWAVVDMDVVHVATICADATAEVAFQIRKDGAVFASGRMEINRAAGGAITAPARSGDACTSAKCRNDANSTEA